MAALQEVQDWSDFVGACRKNNRRKADLATAEEIFDAFTLSAVEDGLISEAELDLLTDTIAGAHDGQLSVRVNNRSAIMLKILEPLLLPGRALLIHDESRPELHGACGVLLNYQPSKPSDRAAILQDPEDDSPRSASPISHVPCHLLQVNAFAEAMRRYPVRISSSGDVVRLKLEHLRPRPPPQQGTVVELPPDLWSAVFELMLPWHRKLVASRVCKEWREHYESDITRFEFIALSRHRPRAAALASELSRAPGRFADVRRYLGCDAPPYVPMGFKELGAGKSSYGRGVRLPDATTEACSSHAQLLRLCQAGALPVAFSELPRLAPLLAQHVQRLYVVEDLGVLSVADVRSLCLCMRVSRGLQELRAVHFTMCDMPVPDREDGPFLYHAHPAASAASAAEKTAKLDLAVEWVDAGLPASLEHLHIESDAWDQGPYFLRRTSWKTRFQSLKTVGCYMPASELADGFLSWKARHTIEALTIEYPSQGIADLADFLAGFPVLRALWIAPGIPVFECLPDVIAGCGDRLEVLHLHIDTEEWHTVEEWAEAFSAHALPRLTEVVILCDSCEFAPAAGTEDITRQLERCLPGSRVLVSDIYETPCNIGLAHRSQGLDGGVSDVQHDIFFNGLLEPWQAHPFCRGALRRWQSERDRRLAALMPVLTTGVIESTT